MSSQTRLQSMPFSVLLPKSGDLSNLISYRELIEDRLATLRSQDGSATQTDVHSRLGEESMLLQVIQWLSMGEGANHG